jgi:hypothetical protein
MSISRILPIVILGGVLLHAQQPPDARQTFVSPARSIS